MPDFSTFTAVPVIFSEVMTSEEKWGAFRKIAVWCFYWFKGDLKIQMIVFLWWSSSSLVPIWEVIPPEHAEFWCLIWMKDWFTKFVVLVSGRMLFWSCFSCNTNGLILLSLSSFLLHWNSACLNHDHKIRTENHKTQRFSWFKTHQKVNQHRLVDNA